MSLKVTKLIGVQANEHDALHFEHNEFIDDRGNTEKFSITIRDGGLENGSAFIFHDIHEAHTFALRMIEQIGQFIDLESK